jgi:hypothetical protein
MTFLFQLRSKVITPSAVASSSTSAPRLANRPLVTTPTMPSMDLQAGRVVDGKIMNVKDQVAVVGDEAVPQHRAATQPDKLT